MRAGHGAVDEFGVEMLQRAGDVRAGLLERASGRVGFQHADRITQPVLDAGDPPRRAARGYRRSPATLPGYLAGRTPATKGQRFPPSPPTVVEIVAMLNACPDTPAGRRLHALILVLWRAGLRISEALALAEHDLDRQAGTVFVRNGKGGKSGTVGIDDWVWPLLDPWLAARRELPVGPLFCVVQGPSAGRRAWGYPSARRTIARLAKHAGVRRRVAPHQFRHAHAVEVMTEGHPMVVLQRQLRHANLQVTTTYMQAFPNDRRHPSHTWPGDADPAGVPLNLRRPRCGVGAITTRRRPQVADTPSAPPAVTEAPISAVEPFPGYDKADVHAIQKRIASIPQGAQRELLKRQVRDAEARRADGPRKGVMDATQPAGVPPLGEVAARRAANRNVRVINTLEEAS